MRRPGKGETEGLGRASEVAGTRPGWPPRPRVGPAFFRAHGLGNDYLVLEEGPGARLTESLVRRICDRRRGPGGDGIVVVEASEPGDVPRLRMFNPDGSEFERSGNGLRVAGVHLVRAGRGAGGAHGSGIQDGPGPRVREGRQRGVPGEEWFPVIVAGDRVKLRIRPAGAPGVHDAAVEMGRVGFPEGPPFVQPGVVGSDGTAVLELQPPGEDAVPARVVPVSVGNPHAVLFAAGRGWSRAQVERLGPLIETHEAFPRGVNVQFAERPAGPRVAIRIWERGVGPTPSSGTSACAAVAAAVRLGLMEAGLATVEMAGGAMQVDLRPDWTVRLQGEVEEVCEGVLLQPAGRDAGLAAHGARGPRRA